ncbi:MAG: type II toxin-antitoxin system RelE/ParE family toxin, partial [Saprospiraceae bacterium]
MNVVLTDIAKKRLKNIFSYYRRKGMTKTGQKIRINVLKKAKLLKQQPLIGQIEENLKNLNQGHRYLVVSNYKILYRIIDKTVFITDIFDTRQNPDKMRNQD